MVLFRDQEGKWKFGEFGDAVIANEALSNFNNSDLIKLGTCPTCKRVVGKINRYSPMNGHLRMIEIMWRTMRDDPKQRGYVRISNNRGKLDSDDRLITIGGANRDQHHKAVWLGLIAPVDEIGKPLPREGYKKRQKRCCYTLTQKGLDLYLGKPISGWTVYRQHGRFVMRDETEKTSGTRRNIRGLTNKEWREENLPPDMADLLVKRPAGIYIART